MMNRSIISLFLLGLFAASAAAEIKVATVSVERCIENYYRTQEVNDRIRSLFETLQAEFNERQEALREEAVPLEERIQEIRENPGLSDEAKQEQLQALAPEVEAFRRKEAEEQEWAQQSRQEAEQSRQAQQRNLIEDVTRVAQAVGVREGYQIVFDTSDVMQNGVTTVLYADPAFDITNKVINELNKDAPAE
ncbi:MAG: OmpH family outer membrane protein [Opitutales bacterium]